MGPKPGQIRCPTCHRSTIPAAYCTHCGSPIPESARARPRGLDREELQERIRARRIGPMPFRRGSTGDDEPWDPPPFAERYVPEPEDERLRRRRGASGAAAAGAARPVERRVDNTSPTFDAEADAEAQRRAGEAAAAHAAPPEQSERDDAERRWARPQPDAGAAGPAAGLAAAAASGAGPSGDAAGPFRRGQEATESEPPETGDRGRPVDAPEPAAPPISRARASAVDVAEVPRAAAPETLDAFDDEAYEEPDPRYYYDVDDERGDGIGVGAVLGIAALGVLALFIGVMLAGVFDDEEGVGRATPTPTVESVVPSGAATESAAESEPPSEAAGTPSPEASPSGGPIVFPDGFVAEAQPCANPPSTSDCGSSGARNNGNVWIVVSFRGGTASDVVGATVARADGSAVPGGGSIDLATIGCASACNGYTYFAFQNLENGTYTVHVTRNGQPAGETGFTVER